MGFFRLNSLTLTTVITLTVSAFVYPSSYCSSLVNKRRSCSVGPLVSLVSSFHQCFPPCFPYGGFPVSGLALVFSAFADDQQSQHSSLGFFANAQNSLITGGMFVSLSRKPCIMI